MSIARVSPAAAAAAVLLVGVALSACSRSTDDGLAAPPVEPASASAAASSAAPSAEPSGSSLDPALTPTTAPRSTGGTGSGSTGTRATATVLETPSETVTIPVRPEDMPDPSTANRGIDPANRGACPEGAAGTLVNALERDLGYKPGTLLTQSVRCYRGWAAANTDGLRLQATGSGDRALAAFDPATKTWRVGAIDNSGQCDARLVPADVAARLGACREWMSSGPLTPVVVVATRPADQAYRDQVDAANANLGIDPKNRGACPPAGGTLVNALEHDLGVEPASLVTASVRCYRGWAAADFDVVRTQANGGTVIARFDPISKTWQLFENGSSIMCKDTQVPKEINAKLRACY